MKAKINFKLNKKYFMAGLLLILIINNSLFFGGINANSQNNENISTSTTVAELGDVQNSIDVVGEAELVDEQSLSFNKTGTIKKVFFKAGDNVKKGDVIAQLDDSDGYDEIEQAKLSLENAKLNLQELYEEVDESKKLKAQNDIDNTQKSINITQEELANLKITQNNSLEKSLQNIEMLQKELETAKNNLEIEKQDLNLLKQEKDNNLSDTVSNTDKIVKNLESGLTSEIVNIEEKIEDIDYILGYTKENEEKNDDFQEELSAKNTEILTSSEISFSKTLASYENIKTKINNYESLSLIDLNLILTDIISCYNSLDETTKLVYNALDNSSATANFSESDIENKKTNMTNNRNNIQSKITSLTTSINSLDTLTDINLLEQTNNNTVLSKQEAIKQTQINIEKLRPEIKDQLEDKLDEDFKAEIQDQLDNELEVELEKRVRAEIGIAKQDYKSFLKALDRIYTIFGNKKEELFKELFAHLMDELLDDAGYDFQKIYGIFNVALKRSSSLIRDIIKKRGYLKHSEKIIAPPVAGIELDTQRIIINKKYTNLTQGTNLWKNFLRDLLKDINGKQLRTNRKVREKGQEIDALNRVNKSVRKLKKKKKTSRS